MFGDIMSRTLVAGRAEQSHNWLRITRTVANRVGYPQRMQSVSETTVYYGKFHRAVLASRPKPKHCRDTNPKSYAQY